MKTAKSVSRSLRLLAVVLVVALLLMDAVEAHRFWGWGWDRWCRSRSTCDIKRKVCRRYSTREDCTACFETGTNGTMITSWEDLGICLDAANVTMPDFSSSCPSRCFY
ncbi:hypothetical protein O3P69_003127 [Scylla paramamosain]|uniref:Uncharacterized protein n=1 Tax=Scylla paramamosain TaxID=85552 RepID=A0AAW0UL47_SCYPA